MLNIKKRGSILLVIVSIFIVYSFSLWTLKEEITRLGEKLRNSEDKLSAAESTKEMLQKELSAYEVTLAKMSVDLEVS